MEYLRYAMDASPLKSTLSPPPKNHPRAPVLLAWEALKGGDVQSALTWIKPLVPQGRRDVLIVWGWILDAKGDVQGAIQAWTDAKHPASLWEAGSRAVEGEQLDKALAYYRAAQVLEPERGVLPLANFLSRRAGNLAAAEVVLRKALAEYPSSELRLPWLNRLGEILREQARWDDAQDTYVGLIAEFPESVTARIGLGWLYYERGAGAEAAIAEFQQAIALDPARGDGYFAIAEVLAQEGHYTQADVWFRLAIERNPRDFNYWLTRANTAREAGNLMLALEIYEETIARFPSFANGYYQAAWAYRLNGQAGEAIAAIEQALAMSPLSEDINVRAGQIYEWAGNAEKARSAYLQVLAINPTNSLALQGLDRLRGEATTEELRP